MRTNTKPKGLIGKVYEDALPPEKAAFRYALEQQGIIDGENYKKRFTDYYQYVDKKGLIPSIYIDAATVHLNYSDQTQMVTA